jgi:hypothetical protein
MENELEARLSAMSEEDLLRFTRDYDSLTDEAQSLVRDEFRHRKLDPPLIDETSASGFEPQPLMTIRQYGDPTEALVARGALESAGIPCSLRDENIVRMNWLWSNLIGGIRLEVAESDVSAAEAVLSQPIPPTIPVEGEPDYEPPRCPQCGSLNVTFGGLDKKITAASMLILGVPPPSPIQGDRWRCDSCGCIWSDDE